MKKSIKFKILLPIMGVVFALLLLLVIIALSVSAGSIRDVTEKKGVAISKITAESLLASLTFMDADGIKNNLKNLTRDEDTIHAQVLNAKLEKVAEVGDAFALDKGTKLDSEMQITAVDTTRGRAQLFLSRIVNPDNKELLGYLAVVVSQAKARQAMTRISTWLITLSVLCLLLIAGLGMFFITRTTGPLIQASGVMEEISSGEGDLTVKLDVASEDEIGRLSDSFNRFMAKILELVKIIKENTLGVSASATEMSSTTEEMAATFEEQNQQTTVVGEAMHAMMDTSAQIKKTAEDMQRAATQATDMTRNGSGIIQRTIESLQLIDSQTSKLGEILTNLNKSTKKIGEIVNVINDVSDQTNLLALNAAIEAARAGEAGRGFAVVADEVRKLAERTSKATGEISEIIATLRRESTMATTAMEDAEEEVRKGSGLGKESLVILNDIIGSSEKMLTASTTVVTAVGQQSATIGDVNNNLQQIVRSISESTKAIGEVARTAEELAHQADSLKQRAERFKTE